MSGHCGKQCIQKPAAHAGHGNDNDNRHHQHHIGFGFGSGNGGLNLLLNLNLITDDLLRLRQNISETIAFSFDYRIDGSKTADIFQPAAFRQIFKKYLQLNAALLILQYDMIDFFYDIRFLIVRNLKIFSGGANRFDSTLPALVATLMDSRKSLNCNRSVRSLFLTTESA